MSCMNGDTDLLRPYTKTHELGSGLQELSVSEKIKDTKPNWLEKKSQ